MQKNLTVQNLIFLGIAIITMIATRGHESWASVNLHLPDFTIIALLIAGVYFRKIFVVISLIIVAVAIDNYAITYQGVSAHCITPAYSLLPLTYYMVFWASKFLTSFVVDANVVQNAMRITLIISMQWLLATLSYYAFTASSWDKFLAYMLHWSVVEIPPILYIVATMMIVFTFAQRFIPALHTQVVKH